jgi:chlorobactene glucosyltransferase
MLLQVIVLAGILIFAVNLIFNLFALRRPSYVTKRLKQTPLVSVLVPARNEEANIENCVRSLLAQDYPEFEITVLDDNSADATASIVARLQDENARVQLLRGKPLPEGWAGKPHACQQLAERARGSWLLFIDADTVHQPYMLRSVMSIAVDEKVSLLSGMPRQLTSGLTQKIVMPLMYFLLMSWFPVWFLNRTARPWPTLAIGQFMLFPREEYWKVGGHAVVKARIIEDVWFGAEIKKAGGRFVCADLSGVMSTNMYSSVAAMTEGWGKWMYSIIAMSPVALAGFFVAAYLFFLAPYFWMVQGLVAGAQFEEYALIAAAQVVIITLMRGACGRHFREPSAAFVFHPLGIMYLVLVAFYSAARHAVGAGITWKDRLYNSRSRVN